MSELLVIDFIFKVFQIHMSLHEKGNMFSLPEAQGRNMLASV